MHGRRRYNFERKPFAQIFRDARSEGGAKPRVKTNADKAENESAKQEIPWLLAKMYAPSPVVNTDQTREEGAGMVQRLYIPVTPEAEQKEHPASQKLLNWFMKGKWK